jgi:hypothetical protein
MRNRLHGKVARPDDRTFKNPKLFTSYFLVSVYKRMFILVSAGWGIQNRQLWSGRWLLLGKSCFPMMSHTIWRRFIGPLQIWYFHFAWISHSQIKPSQGLSQLHSYFIHLLCFSSCHYACPSDISAIPRTFENTARVSPLPVFSIYRAILKFSKFLILLSFSRLASFLQSMILSRSSRGPGHPAIIFLI